MSDKLPDNGQTDSVFVTKDEPESAPSIVLEDLPIDLQQHKRGEDPEGEAPDEVLDP